MNSTRTALLNASPVAPASKEGLADALVTIVETTRAGSSKLSPVALCFMHEILN